jgi:cobalamin biosynthesis protein CbiG
MAEPAIVALTPGGADLGRRLALALGQGEVILARGSVYETLTELFQASRPLVCIMALGIVVRILGPLARDKAREPAVVVVDEAARFAISVLGGHAAGANELAGRVARALGSTAVITTASEALGLPAVDLLGRAWGWKIEPGSALTAVAAAVVRGEPVAVYQDAGSPHWWQDFGDWPASFQRVSTWPPTDCQAALAISDRRLPDTAVPVVTYRPPSLVLGVGCRRGVPREEIEELFTAVCAGHGLAPLSLRLVATVSLKAGEPGLVAFAAGRGVLLQAFGIEELAAVGPLPTPSETVRSKIGIAGVAEPAALLAAGSTGLLVPKQRGRRVTLALARMDEA